VWVVFGMAAKITALQKLGCAVVFPHQRSTLS